MDSALSHSYGRFARLVYIGLNVGAILYTYYFLGIAQENISLTGHEALTVRMLIVPLLFCVGAYLGSYDRLPKSIGGMALLFIPYALLAIQYLFSPFSLEGYAIQISITQLIGATIMTPYILSEVFSPIRTLKDAQKTLADTAKNPLIVVFILIQCYAVWMLVHITFRDFIYFGPTLSLASVASIVSFTAAVIYTAQRFYYLMRT